MIVERRKNKRFPVHRNTLAVLTPGWPHSVTVGDILDIGTGGLSCRYVANGAPSNGASELTIACTRPVFFLRNMPIKAASDLAMIKTRNGDAVPRRLSFQFGELTADQMSQLKSFIGNHTTSQA